MKESPSQLERLVNIIQHYIISELISTMTISLVTGEPSTTTKMAELVETETSIFEDNSRKKTVTRYSSLHSLQQISTSS